MHVPRTLSRRHPPPLSHPLSHVTQPDSPPPPPPSPPAMQTSSPPNTSDPTSDPSYHTARSDHDPRRASHSSAFCLLHVHTAARPSRPRAHSRRPPLDRSSVAMMCCDEMIGSRRPLA